MSTQVRNGRSLPLQGTLETRILRTFGGLAAAIILPIGLALWDAPTIRAQIATANAPKFEVASIKPCQEPPQQPGRVVRPGENSSPGRLSTGCFPLLDVNGLGLITDAYILFADGHPAMRELTPITGGPSWLRSARYEIDAKADGNPGVEMMMGPMLQALLEDRFQLKIHRQTTEGPVYVLSVARSGPKLHPFIEGSCALNSAYPLPPLQPGQQYCRMLVGARSPASVETQGATLGEFSKMLRLVFDRPVIDQTGIPGRFDIHIEFSREGTKMATMPLMTPIDGPSTASDPTGPPSIFTVLQEQLGLRLESGKGPVDMLIIDHIERPSEN